MTVRELIEYLEELPPETPVAVSEYNKGYDGLFRAEPRMDEHVFDGENHPTPVVVIRSDGKL
jgi:hypothetical protein